MKLGMVGLGRMGGNMAERLRRSGHEVVGYDAFSDTTEVASLAGLVTAAGEPGQRVVWSMVPAGEPTESVINELAGLLDPGDLIVDGGNSKWRDSIDRAERLAAVGIRFVDAGVSGGVWGLENGYCLMVGGDADDVRRLMPMFDALRPVEGGFVHAGPVGSGHYTKMVHNGIEYGLMQAFAEGYEILEAVELDIDIPGTLAAWQTGSVVRCWLLELLVAGLEANGGTVAGIEGVARDSGEGRWTVDEAVRLGVPANVVAGSLFARFASQRESSAMKVIALLRNQFGGHVIAREEEPL